MMTTTHVVMLLLSIPTLLPLAAGGCLEEHTIPTCEEGYTNVTCEGAVDDSIIWGDEMGDLTQDRLREQDTVPCDKALCIPLGHIQNGSIFSCTYDSNGTELTDRYMIYVVTKEIIITVTTALLNVTTSEPAHASSQQESIISMGTVMAVLFILVIVLLIAVIALVTYKLYTKHHATKEINTTEEV